MTSYLRDWLFSSTTPAEPPVPIVELISPPPSEDEDGEETETERDDNSVPAFPALNSAQRLQTSNKVLTDSQLMPPPPVPSRSSGASTLVVPPSTTKAPVKKRGKKVALAPGHSPLDWAALKTSGQDLRVSITINPHNQITKHLLFRELTRCCAYLRRYSSYITNGTTPGLLSMEKYTISLPICHIIPEERRN